LAVLMILETGIGGPAPGEGRSGVGVTGPKAAAILGRLLGADDRPR